MEFPTQADHGDGAGNAGSGPAGRPASWAPAGAPAGGPLLPGQQGMRGPSPDVIRSILAADGAPSAVHDTVCQGVPGPDVVRSILAGTRPVGADQLGEAVGAGGAVPPHAPVPGPVAPIVLATTNAGAPRPAGVPVGETTLVPVENALADVIGRAEHSGTPFTLLLARPGGAARAGYAPVPSAADVADLGAAFTAALGPAESLHSAGLSHVAAILPGKAKRDATALTQRTADLGAPTFTWVALRYPTDARTARGLLQLAAHRLDGTERVVADELTAAAWWRRRGVLAAVGSVAAVLLVLGLTMGASHGRRGAQGGDPATGGASDAAGQAGAPRAGSSSAGTASPSSSGSAGSSPGSPTGAGSIGASATGASTGSGTGQRGVPAGGTASTGTGSTGSGGGPAGTGSTGGGTTSTGTGSTGSGGGPAGTGSTGGGTTGSGSGGTTGGRSTGSGTTGSGASGSSSSCSNGSNGGLLGVVGGLVNGLLGGGSRSCPQH